jgi:hypothetical protein
MSKRTIAALRFLALALGLVLAVAAEAHAEPQPLTKEEQAKVDQAIDKGITFLKKMQKKNGSWEPYFSHLVGSTALPALALLEAGVPADDPVVQKAAQWLRPRVTRLEETYDLALALLFFARLGDPQDKAAIRSLAMRLIAGQRRSGGWTYRCTTLSPKNEEALTELLRQREEAASEKKAPPAVPAPFKSLTVFQDPRKLAAEFPTAAVSDSDNSNTQFAILALWVARRHGVSVGSMLGLAAYRFENTQNPIGTWAYRFSPAQPLGGDRHLIGERSMTTVGLLGLAVRDGLRPEKDAPAGTPDPQILKGFAAVSQLIGVPAVVPEAGLTGPLSNRDLYYLWSLERVAMLYDLPLIGGKDWYRWGADILLSNQTPTGAFGPLERRAGGESTINTSFALLFLKRSHLLRDLTAKLPCKAEVVEKGIAAALQGGRLPAGPAQGEASPKKP